jgi:hypothetical protein
LPLELPTARRFVTGIVVGLIPVIVFAALGPLALFDNVVLFHIVRPPSSASLLSGIAPSVVWPLRIGVTATALLTAATALICDWSIDRRILGYVVLTIVVVLTSQTNFDNYWLWWIPLYLPLLCAGRVAPATAITPNILHRKRCLFRS